MHKLVISDDEGKTTVVPLVRSELTIGRREGHTIRLTERNVSRDHARLRRNGDGYLVEDLRSYNGIRVNGRPIDGPERVRVGDSIAIGDYTLAIEDDAQPVEAPPDRRTTAKHRREPAPVAAPAPARLVLLSAPAPGAEFALSRQTLRIGRAEDLDIWINHKSISRVHAEVACLDGTYRVRDVGSSNGLRVNGRKVEEAVLAPGDVLDLGQVRLRFVAPGEPYRFELDRTAEMASLPPLRRRRRGVHPAAVAVVVVGVTALSAGIGLALSAQQDRAAARPPPRRAPAAVPPPAASPRTAPPPPTASGAVAVPEEEAPEATAPEAATTAVEPPADAALAATVEAAVARCRAALAAERWEEALAAVAGLAGERVAACAEEARLRITERQIFERGVALHRAGDLDGARFALIGLEEGSPYRRREEVQEIADAFAARQLDLADDLRRRDPSAARRAVEAALAVEGTSEAMQRRAERAARALRRRRGPAEAGETVGRSPEPGALP